MTKKQLQIMSQNTITNLLNEVRSIGTETPVLLPVKNCSFNERNICIYKVEKLSYDEKYPMREAFENILTNMDDDSFNLIYIIDGDISGISVYIGIAKVGTADSKFSAGNFGDIICKSFESNYNGSVLRRITNDNGQLSNTILGSAEKFRNFGCIVGVPGTKENEQHENVDFQGIDRLINTMLGSVWRMMVVCEPVSKSEISKLQDQVFDLYNRLSTYSRSSLQQSINYGESNSKNTSFSDTSGRNIGVNKSQMNNKGKSNYDGTINSGTSDTNGTQKGISFSSTYSSSATEGTSKGASSAVTVEITNKYASEILKYIDDELIPRLNTGFTRGMYRTSISYMATNPADTIKLKAGILSLFRGEASSFSTLAAVPIEIPHNIERSSFLNCFTSRKYIKGIQTIDPYVLNCRPVSDENALLCTYLTPKEVSVIAALPQKEVPGLALRESVEFGLNENAPNNDHFTLGHIMQRGRKLDIPFELDQKSLTKHTFVAGVTGSGKTTTCHRLLHEAGLPFLVIEPAKTEYRALLMSEDFKDITVFTLGNESVAPFRFNPFELVEGELLSAHIDMMKAAFTSAFPMEASMPQLLEEAIIRCYEKKGWLIGQNLNTKYNTPEDVALHRNEAYPILSELLAVMNEVVEEKHFGNELKSNYIGSLVSRLSNLTVGSKGNMLDCGCSVDFNYLLHHNVIIEMDEMKSPEDKSLIMGFLLMRLCAAVRNEHKKDPSFRHITLIEEAHRLLSRPDFGDGGARKAAVETFTDMLAEVRKYGEGLVIADQIPNKLAPDVLKNTNTKIIHKILARDDKDAVGDTMLMDDKQKDYLSALLTGQAIIFSENTEKPVHISIDRLTDTNAAEVDDDTVQKAFLKTKDNLGNCYDDIQYTKAVKPFLTIIRHIKNGFKGDQAKEALNSFGSFVNEKGIDVRKCTESLLLSYYRKTGKSISDDPETISGNIKKICDYIESCIEQNEMVSNMGIIKYL